MVTPVLERGVTLIELMAAMTIIGILASVALPQFAEYRAKSYDADAYTTLRTVATAEEAYFADFGSYVDCDQTNCSTILDGVDPIPPNISLAVTSTGGDFTATATHAKGSGKVFQWP